MQKDLNMRFGITLYKIECMKYWTIQNPDKIGCIAYANKQDFYAQGKLIESIPIDRTKCRGKIKHDNYFIFDEMCDTNEFWKMIYEKTSD